ncbi:uncharacterized protein LOC124149628 [Haliotis rufescens]|uniref:uncharacterized protein LOC124149628 n=1 Tax=Haliotis rufescens TaxID=6454 RepID=UPI00201F95DB|nr:uncharacterized protein LOC124149628 [Haliotis rufescens]
MSSSKQPLSPQTVPCRSPRRPGLHVDQPELDEPEEFFIKSSVGQQVIVNYQDTDTCVRGHAPGYRTTPVEVVEGMSMTGDLRKCVPGTQHLPVNGAIPYPSLHVGDKVRVRQFNTETAKELFRPATVQALPLRPMSKHAFFKVSLDVVPTDLEREVKRIDLYPWPGHEEEKQDEISKDELLLIRLRRLLPTAKIGEDVLFKSQDDGWYYSGKVSLDCGDFSYIITDCNGFQEKVWRENIICESDRHVDAIKKRSKVLVMHPMYPNSYCPATVLEIRDKTWSVRLPDMTKPVRVSQEQDYIACLALKKGVYDEKVLNTLAKKWEQMDVLAKHKNGEYHIGTVKELVSGSLTKYVITWLNNTESVVDAIHMFGGLTPFRRLRVNDHVLAPVAIIGQANPLCYLPGVVVEKRNEVTAVIKMIHAQRLDDLTTINEKECFFINPLYYATAVSEYLNNHARS